MEIKSNKQAYDVLQVIKESLQNTADAAGLPPTEIEIDLRLKVREFISARQIL